MMIESVPQVFDLDPLLNGSKNLSLEDLIKRLLKFIISIASCSRWWWRLGLREVLKGDLFTCSECVRSVKSEKCKYTLYQGLRRLMFE